MSPNLMEPPPPNRDQEEPEITPAEALRVLLWVVVFVLGFIELVVWLAQSWTRPL